MAVQERRRRVVVVYVQHPRVRHGDHGPPCVVSSDGDSLGAAVISPRLPLCLPWPAFSGLEIDVAGRVVICCAVTIAQFAFSNSAVAALSSLPRPRLILIAFLTGLLLHDFFIFAEF